MTRSEYLTKRNELTDKARAIVEAARADYGRGLTPEESKRFDVLMRQVEELRLDFESAEPIGEPRNINAEIAASERASVGAPTYRDGDVAILAPSRSVASVVRGDRILGASEARGVSFGRILRAHVTGNRTGLSDVERRVMSEGNDSAGGFTVPDVLGARVIDRVRNAMAVMQAGAQTIPMTSDTLNLARLASGPSLAWKAESAAIAAGDLTFERVQLVAKTLPCLVKMSVELAEDSAPGVEEIIENELARALAIELDRVALRGSGTAPEPRGIRNQSGVTIIELGSGDGATPTYDNLTDAIGSVWSANAEPTARIYASRTATTFAKMKDTTGQPLRAPEAVAKVREIVSNQCPIDLTVGVNDDASEIYVGRFSDVLVGLRTTFRLEASRTAGDSFDNLQIAIRCYLRADIALAHSATFAVLTGVRA